MIALLDLEHTLVANHRELRGLDAAGREAQEQYRAWLLAMVRGCCERVFIVTARKAKDYDWTLRSIKAKLGWLPERAYFYDGRLGEVEPWEWHHRVVTKTLRGEFGSVATPQFLAFSSDISTIERAYLAHGIEAVHVMPPARQERGQEDRKPLGKSLF